MKKPKLSSKIVSPDEAVVDLTLRPKTLGDYIGQDQVKRNLYVLLEAAKKRKESIEHVLIHGPAGLGKTTLAYVIANQMNAQIKVTSGAALEKVGDIGSILTNLANGDILFVDEAHRMNKMIEEILYPAMENFKLDIVIGKGPSARTIQIDLPNFTLIAATTRISLLSSPFRSRFGVQYKLGFYDTASIAKIIERSARLLGINLEAEAVSIIAAASRATPRTANRLLKRVRDLAQIKNMPSINAPIANEALTMFGIDQIGLEVTDRKILKTIFDQFDGGPVGLKTIAAAIAEEEETLAEVHEPYLMQCGLLARTPRGRITTTKAVQYLSATEKDSSRLL